MSYTIIYNYSNALIKCQRKVINAICLTYGKSYFKCLMLVIYQLCIYFRHAGDLGNIDAVNNKAIVDISDKQISLFRERAAL